MPLIHTLLLVAITAVWAWTFVVVQDAICEILEDVFSSYVGQYCFAYQGLPFYGEHQGKRHCVLHFPGDGKAEEFNEAVQRKVRKGDFNLRKNFFPAHMPRFFSHLYPCFTKATFADASHLRRAAVAVLSIEIFCSTYSAARGGPTLDR